MGGLLAEGARRARATAMRTGAHPALRGGFHATGWDWRAATLPEWEHKSIGHAGPGRSRAWARGDTHDGRNRGAARGARGFEGLDADRLLASSSHPGRALAGASCRNICLLHDGGGGGGGAAGRGLTKGGKRVRTGEERTRGEKSTAAGPPPFLSALRPRPTTFASGGAKPTNQRHPACRPWMGLPRPPSGEPRALLAPV